MKLLNIKLNSAIYKFPMVDSSKWISSFFLIIVLLPLNLLAQEGTSLSEPMELGIITSTQGESLLESRIIGDFPNSYGGVLPDVVYRFVVTGNTELNIALGYISQASFYILDGQGQPITMSQVVTEWDYQTVNIGAGTYYLIIEALSNSILGELSIDVNFFVHDDSGITLPTEGKSFSSPIVIPNVQNNIIDYSDIRSFAPIMGYGNDYLGTFSDDIFYKFVLASQSIVNINTCPNVYFNVSIKLYLLNSNGDILFSSNGTSSSCYGPLIEASLQAGEYFIIVEGDNDLNYAGSYALNVRTRTKPYDGTSLSDAILIGNYKLGGFYSYHDNKSNNTINGYGNSMGQPSDDIYYKLLLGNAANLSISMCGSNFDTYLYLLDAGGNIIYQNNDNGPICSGQQSSLQVNNLSAGTYYIVVEGNGDSSGNTNLYVNTVVQGNESPTAILPTTQLTMTENYISTKTLLQDNILSESQLAALSPNSYRTEVMYYDGLGRPIQARSVGASPDGKDIVSPIAYDLVGREDKKYLPYEASIGNGGYESDAMTTQYMNSAQYQFYQQDHTSIAKMPNPYTQSVYELSPLDRILEVAGSGKTWGVGAGHTIQSKYLVNAANEVRLWNISLVNGVPSGASTNGLYYGKGQLFKNVVISENGSRTIEYKDKDGQIVSKHVQDGGTKDIPTYAITDYVYDNLGNLVYVVTPALSSLQSFTESDSNFDQHIYAYHYDGRKRLVAKKVPAAGWAYMVYNNADRPIFTQDAAQRERLGGAVWSFMKYDRLGRVIVTGELVSSLSRESLQNQVNSELKPVGAKELYENWNVNANYGYTSSSYPDHNGAGVQILTVNYFDNYHYLNVPVIAGKTQAPRFRQPNGAVDESLLVNGLSTGSLVRILGSTDFLLYETLYDAKGRISKTIMEHALNGVDETVTGYNMVGEVLSVQRKQYKDNVQVLDVLQQHTYDHAGRVVASSEQINGQTPAITQFVYNALGQLEVKKAGGKSIVHQYNARGWLKKSSSPLFSYSLEYDSPSDPAKAQYNGNISEQIWVTGGNLQPYRYAYSYDMGDKLLKGQGSDGNSEMMQYDKMGNITQLSRAGQPSLSGAIGTFAYNYGTNGSRLQSVSNGAGYSRNYQYNGLGSMVADGQIKVQYNEVGLPRLITDNNNVPKLSYIYAADGTKLSKSSALGTRHYVAGVEYLGVGSGAAIDLIHTTEGIARNASGTYNHEYFLRDHLGNTRVVFNGAGAVLQQTDYMPFGMEINRMVSSPKMDYTYNGKEFQQELDQYDYGARFYDPVIGRWNVVDPLVEVNRRFSPYVYGNNNPIRFIDPDGMAVEEINGGTRYTDEDAQAMFNQLKSQYSSNQDDDQEDPPKKSYWNSFINATNSGSPFHRAGQNLSRYIGEGPSALLGDLGQMAGGITSSVGSLLFAETYVNGYNNFKSYLNASPGERGAVDGAALSSMIEGAVTYAPLGYFSAVPNAVRGLNHFEIAVYRVYGGGASMYGKSYSVVNPLYVPNYRRFAGLPNVNSGEYLLKGYIPLKDIKIGRLFAAPLDGNIGGLPFELYQNFNQLRKPSNVILKSKF